MGDLRRTVVERHYKDVADKNYDRIREHMHEDVVTTMPGAGEMRGADAFIGYAQNFFTALPDAHMEVHAIVEEGDTVIAVGEFVGTHTGPLATPDGQQVPATGRSIALPFADFFKIEGDRVKTHKVYFDQATLMEQLGLVPQAAAAGR